MFFIWSGKSSGFVCAHWDGDKILKFKSLSVFGAQGLTLINLGKIRVKVRDSW